MTYIFYENIYLKPEKWFIFKGLYLLIKLLKQHQA